VQRYPDAEIELQVQGKVPTPDTVLKLLNHYEDRLVVFRAVARKDTETSENDQNSPPTRLETVLRQASAPESNRASQHETSPQLPPKGASPIASADATAVPLTPVSASVQSIAAPPRNMSRNAERSSAEPGAQESPHMEVEPGLPVEENLVNRIPNQPLPTLPVSDAQPSSPAPGVLPPSHSSSYPPVKAEHCSPPPSSGPEPIATMFDPEGVFEQDPYLEVDTESEMKPKDHFIREIIDQQSPEILEAGVARSKQVLQALENTFTKYKATSVDANAWIQAIGKLMGQSQRTRTVVGVVGNTGAGKSSVINAMLDEERLVPTNCMRACTAVVTEMSWNDNNDPDHKYRAEIEFVSRADWQTELKILLKEFLTDNGTVSKESFDQNSDAGIAWAKFHAVYPKIHKDELDQWTVEKLMGDKAVLNVLDTTKRINKAHPESFYVELQKYVDSKEKVTGKKEKGQKRPPAVMEYWPLIKVVKIYTKSLALSTGAVIVDLPGVHDSNAARAAVAGNYMKQCTGLWIVAPITRAVDDKAAKNLLGDSFKRQLKYDGSYSSVTFICSKTDDISITEATDSLELDDQISGLEDQRRLYKKEVDEVSNRIAELKESLQVYRAVMAEADDDLEIWDGLKDSADNGEPVFAPVKKASKRKRLSPETKSRKRRQAEDDDSDAEYISSDTEAFTVSDDSDSDGIQAPRLPLTREDIKRKLEELKLSKKNARQEEVCFSNVGIHLGIYLLLSL
jgi:hypothetical protein